MFEIVEKARTHLGEYATLPLRLVVGYGFLSHGIAKIVHDPVHFAALLQALDVPWPLLSSWATIAVEILGGVAVLLGAFVPLASLPIAVVLLVATFTVHLRYGFSSIKLLEVTASGARFGPPGIEVNLLYLACLATLVLAEPGPYSFDSALRRRKDLDDKR